MESIYPDLALCGSKNLCARTDTVFFPISEVNNGPVSLEGIPYLYCASQALFNVTAWYKPIEGARGSLGLLSLAIVPVTQAQTLTASNQLSSAQLRDWLNSVKQLC